jgi:hypothetical protein
MPKNASVICEGSLKSCPIFNELTFIDGIENKKNPSIMLILGQKSGFLGPTIFEIQQPH